MTSKKNILVLIYGHPEYYPPTLNAIDELSNTFDDITILHRPFLNNAWSYKENVYLVESGKKINVKQQEKSGTLKKVFYYMQFTLNLFKLLFSKKYDTILVYDYLPMLSLYLVRPFLNKKTKLWYHNHDIASFDNLRKYSIGWLALHAEHKLMKRFDIFSLPAKERLSCFCISDKTKIFIMPNYPSKKRYKELSEDIKKSSNTYLVYQGTIGEGHGLEAITEAINSSKQLADYRLNLIGNISEEFKSELEQLNSKRRIDYLGYISYNQLPSITAQYHIGIAVNVPNDIIYKTGGSASNKIYEYAACGLPILYFDDPHYSEYLSRFEWALATDLSTESIEKCILEIMNNHEYLSQKARADFEHKLNFEKVFEPVVSNLKDLS